MNRFLGKELLLYLPSQIVPALLSFASVLFFTRLLSAEQFGRYALVMSSVLIATTLLDWLCMAIIRFYPATSAPDVPVLVRTAFWTQAVLAGVVGAAAFLLVRLLWPADVLLQRLMGIGVLIFVFNSVFFLLSHVLRARMQAGAYSLFMIWARAAGLGLGILFAVLFQLGEAGILWGVALGVATAFPFLWRKVFAQVPMVGPMSRGLLRDMAWYGVPLMVGNLGDWVLRQSDRYLIQLFYGAREVGIYSAVHMISENSVRILAQLFMAASVPLLIRVWENQGEEASKRLISSVTRLYLLSTIPIVAAMSALAKPIMDVLTGSDFSDGYIMVPPVVLGAFFIGLQHRFNQVLLLVKRSQVIMRWTMAVALLNVALNWWLLPLVDYKIAAVNTCVCFGLYCVALAWESRRHLRWPFPWLTVIRSGVAAGVIFGAAFLLTRDSTLSPLWMLCLAAPLGILLYGLSLWGLGEITAEERQTLADGSRRYVARLTSAVRAYRLGT